MYYFEKYSLKAYNEGLLLCYQSLKIISTKKLAADPESVMADLFKFLGVSAKSNINYTRKYNQARSPRFQSFNYFISKTGIKKPLFHLFPQRYQQRIKGLFFTRRNTPKLKTEDRAFLSNFLEEGSHNLAKLIGAELTYWG